MGNKLVTRVTYDTVEYDILKKIIAMKDTLKAFIEEEKMVE
jgi:hypothetical protein